MALGGLGPRSQGQGREGAAGVQHRAEQCQCLFLGVTQPCNYAEPRGAGAGATVLALGRRPGKRPFNCHCHARHIASGGLRLPGSQLACHLSARRGRGRVGCGRPGSWCTGHAAAVPCRQAQSHCLPSDKKCGLVFSLLEKMSGPRSVSARQEEPGAGEGLYWPTLPPGAPPQGPHLLSARSRGTGWGPVPSVAFDWVRVSQTRAGTTGFTPLPRRSWARALGLYPGFWGAPQPPRQAGDPANARKTPVIP